MLLHIFNRILAGPGSQKSFVAIKLQQMSWKRKFFFVQIAIVVAMRSVSQSQRKIFERQRDNRVDSYRKAQNDPTRIARGQIHQLYTPSLYCAALARPWKVCPQGLCVALHGRGEPADAPRGGCMALCCCLRISITYGWGNRCAWFWHIWSVPHGLVLWWRGAHWTKRPGLGGTYAQGLSKPHVPAKKALHHLWDTVYSQCLPEYCIFV